MPEVKTLDRKRPFVEIRDRSRPNVKFQQDDNLFDRKEAFFEKADFPIEIAAPPPPQVKIREISQRSIGTTKKSIVEKVTDLVVGDRVIATAGNQEIKRGRGRPPGAKNKPSGVDATLRAAAKENAAASAAESQA